MFQTVLELSKKTLEFSGILQRILECSWSFLNILKRSRKLHRYVEYSILLRNFWENRFRKFQNFLEFFKMFRKVSTIFQNKLDCSRNIPNFLHCSQSFPSFPASFRKFSEILKFCWEIEFTECFRQFQQLTTVFQRILECSINFSNVPEYFRRFHYFLEFLKVSKFPKWEFFNML